MNNNTFMLRNVTERKVEQSEEFYIPFTDLGVAFDIVNREIIWESTRKFK